MSQTNSGLNVRNGGRIRLNFALSTVEGLEIDSNFDQPPVELLVGNGDMLPGFEATLIGLKAGDEVQQLIGAESAFGRSSEDNRQKFKRSLFDAEMEVAPGLIVSFADQSGAELPGVVVEIEDEHGLVLVDFNHPLADKDILFKALVHEVFE